ncbi:MAG: anti-sigma factor family protein [Dehalococcoidia bacterium]
MFGRGHKSECKRVRERFSSFLDGRLDHVEEDEVRYHIQRCEHCRSELESMEATRDLLQWMPSENVPRHFALPEVWRGWVREPLIVRSMQGLRVAAAAVMVAFVVLLAGDLSGAFYTQVEPSVSSQPSATSEEKVTESGEVEPEEEAAESQLSEAVPPEPRDYEGHRGIAGLPGDERDTPADGERESTLPEVQEPVKPYSWLHPGEIAAFAVIVILGGAYFWAWRERRRLTDRRGEY